MRNHRPTTRSKNKRPKSDDNVDASSEIFRFTFFFFILFIMYVLVFLLLDYGVIVNSRNSFSSISPIFRESGYGSW